MSNVFENIKEAPRDPILGLTEEFKSDSNSNKVNLSVGVYQDDNGKTPTFESVILAERKLIELNSSKTYKPIDGDSVFLDESLKLVMGKELYSECIFYKTHDEYLNLPWEVEAYTKQEELYQKWLNTTTMNLQKLKLSVEHC